MTQQRDVAVRGWILWMLIGLGLLIPAVGGARECRAGQPVPDRYPSSVARAPTALEQQAHTLACERLEQRDRPLRPWLRPVHHALTGVLLGAALLCAVTLFRQWRWRYRGRAGGYAFVAAAALSAGMLLKIAVAVYRGVTLSNVRGPPRWLWYELSPVAFTVQQCIEAAFALGWSASGGPCCDWGARCRPRTRCRAAGQAVDRAVDRAAAEALQRREASLCSRTLRNSDPSSQCGQRRLLASSAPRSYTSRVSAAWPLASQVGVHASQAWW